MPMLWIFVLYPCAYLFITVNTLIYTPTPVYFKHTGFSYFRSPRGLLSKQFSLPSGARNPRQLKGGHQRHHASLRHDPAPQRLFEAPTLTRRASARERTSSGGSGAASGSFLSARRTASGGGDRPLGRHSGSINLGSVSPRSPIPPNLGGSVSPRNHFRSGQSPSPHHAPSDETQHIW